MRPAEERGTRLLFDRLDWIEVSDAVAEQAGALANRFARSHPGIDPVDYVIAATVERLGAQLWTRNVRHFPMFPDLRPPY
jgi:predicted nucleic acid-binding protein